MSSSEDLGQRWNRRLIEETHPSNKKENLDREERECKLTGQVGDCVGRALGRKTFSKGKKNGGWAPFIKKRFRNSANVRLRGARKT